MLETVRAYGLEKLEQAGERDRVTDAFAGYYLELAQTADSLLRTSAQLPWYHTLLAEQDNTHAALRALIGRRDTERALLLVRALGFYWVQLGHGEGDRLARDAMALGRPARESRQLAEARVIGALVAAGWAWEVDTVRDVLTEALADLARWSAEIEKFHPLAAFAEPMLALYDGDHELAMSWFERCLTAPDPWVRAMGRLYRGSYSSTLGRVGEGAEEDCRAALAEFRALGDTWAMAVTLAQLAEFTEIRGDHAASIAVLEEATPIGRELGVWGDLPYLIGRLASVRAKAGDLDRAWAEWNEAERLATALDGGSESLRWLSVMRGEIAWLAGDLAEVTRSCARTLDQIKDARAAWWESLRAQVRTRLAMVALAQADKERARQLLDEALAAATGWMERPPVALVAEACAAWVADGDPARAATLLGAAQGVRGAFDVGRPDAMGVRAAARQRLGEAAFEAAYQEGRDLSFDAAVGLIRTVLSQPPAA
jgi:hypothetical protein